MSDPVSNAEIEDVLSSIRRLVSNGQHEKPESSATVVEKTDDRLVLTPALRVDDSDSAQERAPDPFEAGGAGDVAEYDSHESHAPDTDAEAAESPEPDEADYDHAPADEPADGPQDSAADDTEVENRDAADRPDENGDSAEPMTAEHRDSDENASDEVTCDDGPDAWDGGEGGNIAPLEDRIAEVEAAVAARHDEWEPDGDSTDPYSGSEVTPMAWEDYASEPQDEAEEPDPAPEVATLVLDREGWQAGAEQAEDVDTDRNAPEAGEDHRDSDESGRGLWFEDDAVIDEEALRDMVSEIVRQELQGALGERITRNVRKLVRREIHRALTSQEFD